jgi:hypothetical protein
MLRMFAIAMVFSLSGQLAYGLTVPDDECPNNWPDEVSPAECSYTHTCTRSDGAAEITDTGTPDTVLGAALDCDNCDPGCPETVPPPMTCTDTLTVTYTESLSATVSGNIEVGGPGIKASLGSTIGAEDGRQMSGSVTCGSGAFAPCKKGSYNAQMNVYLNIKAKMVHTYTWNATKVSGPSSCSGEHTDAGGTSTSTATGNKGSNSASCKWGGYTSC